MNRTARRLARRTTLCVVVAGLAVIILAPVFFLVSFSFMSDFEAHREWPLPLWPAISARFKLERSDQGYLLSVRKRSDGSYATLSEAPDFARMARFASEKTNSHLDAEEIRRQGERLLPGQSVSFDARRRWLANYLAFFRVTSDAAPALWRSVYTAGLTILISLVIGGLAGFAFARHAFRGKSALKISTLFVRMFPGVSIAIPMVFILGYIGLYDNPIGLSLVYSVGQIGLTVWITASVFMGIPVELEEAAQVFGASPRGAFLRVTLPLALPGLAACAMYAFIAAWNETIQAIVLTQLHPTFPVVVYQSLLGARGLIHLSAAGGVVMAAPAVLFTFMIRKYILRLWGGVNV